MVRESPALVSTLKKEKDNIGATPPKEGPRSIGRFANTVMELVQVASCSEVTGFKGKVSNYATKNRSACTQYYHTTRSYG